MAGVPKVIIGNVLFNKDDVKSQSITFQNGERLNCVFLKDGTKLTFKNQEQRGNVTSGYNDYYKENHGVKFSGIKGLSIEGTESHDFYYLDNCDNFNINTAGDRGNSDRIVIDGTPNYSHIQADGDDNVTQLRPEDNRCGQEGLFWEPYTRMNPEP